MSKGSSEKRIPVAREIPNPPDTDPELAQSGERDTFPPDEGPTAEIPAPTGDTIPTPPPSSGVVDHLVIPPLPAVNIDDGEPSGA